MAFLVSQMFPGTLMLIPLYIILVSGWAWARRCTGLVLVYTTTAIPFCVWMLKGYFDTIPRELEEAALIDGASQATIFWRIILPLAKPAVAVTALFSFMTGVERVHPGRDLHEPGGHVHRRRWACASSSAASRQQWGYFAAGSIIVADARGGRSSCSCRSTWFPASRPAQSRVEAAHQQGGSV